MTDENIELPTSWDDFVSKSQRYRYIPTDAFSHASELLSTDTKEATEFSELLNKHVLLGNIDSDELMRFYQIDAYYLTHFFAMGKRNSGMMTLFKQLFSAWIYEIALTRAKGGLERRLQSLLPSMPQVLRGFGQSFEDREKAKIKQREDTLNAIFG